MKLTAVVPFFTAILLFAGCIVGPEIVPEGPAEPTVAFPADWYVNAIPSTSTHSDHKHGDRSDHAGLTTPNFAVQGWDPLKTATFDTTLTGMGCGGAVTREDGRRLAVVHSIATTVSFVVADITDPAAPKMLGEYYLPNAVVWDADISADGKHVLIGAYPPGPLFGREVTPPKAETPFWAVGHTSFGVYRDSCSGEVIDIGPAHYLPGPAIVMVGIHDPTKPQFEQYVPQPVIGPHSVGSQKIGGIVYATSSVTNLVHSGSYYTIFEIQDTAAGGILVPRWALQTPGIVGPGDLNGHTDVFLQEHPITRQLLAHLANWDGYYVFDLSLPVPLQVSVWKDGNAGNVHTTYPFPEPRGGKQFMLVGQEVGEPDVLPSGWVYILDITDPTKPTEVGRWTLPVKPKWDDGGLMFSPHYVAVLDNVMFVSNYHGGLWAVDITDLGKPEAIGLFVPDRDAPNAYGNGHYGPSLEDVIVDPATRLLTTWDNAGGVYQLTFDGMMAAPHAPVWSAPT